MVNLSLVIRNRLTARLNVVRIIMGDSPDDEALARELHRELNVGPRRRQRRQAVPQNRANPPQKRAFGYPTLSQLLDLSEAECVLSPVEFPVRRSFSRVIK